MTTKASSLSDPTKNVVLKSSQRLPLLIIAVGISSIALPLNIWPSMIISLFGLFLLIQSLILKLEFTPDDLVVLQLGRELRRFPFKDWIAWRLLLPKLPGLFYFREKASPHLLPILFDPIALESELKQRVGQLETPNKKI